MQPTSKLIREVQHFLDRMCAAMTSGDVEAVSALWEMPALVIGDDMSMAFAKAEQMHEYMRPAKAQYNERGITDTRAEILALEDLTPKIVLATVRFPWIDAKGEEKGGEMSTYALCRDQTGALRLRFAAMHGTGM